MLLAIGAVAGGQVSQAASAAAARLVEAGVVRPRWAAELAEPIEVTDCWRLGDSDGLSSVLVCSFRRAGRASHAAVISVDHLDCGAASEIHLVGADQLHGVLEQMRASGGDLGLEIVTTALDPAELRWQVESAMEARAVHDAERSELGMAEPPGDEGGGPDYRTLAVLMRARISALPAPSRPAGPHGGEHSGPTGLAVSRMLAKLAGSAGDPFDAVAPLPARRAEADPPAPVYRIKIGLRGAKPPIWRRIEVPGDIGLDRLHAVIQIAFDWDDSHLHVFETPYGRFGTADVELGHHDAASVTLEQVAPAERNKIRYSYDFGDDWQHDIVVEKLLAPDLTGACPRCTGGWRAAPPEDCGGIWGYAGLVETLNDPAAPEHAQRLEWLGLDDATDFDPDRFDAEAVTRALANLP